MSRHVRPQDVMELMQEQEREWPGRELGLRMSGVPLGFDAHKNLVYSTVATAPSPATSGTSLVVAAGDGVKMPAVSFNAIVWPVGVNPTTANAEIVRVTARTTDTLTITRAQEGSSARTVVVGDQIAAPVTLKMLTDIEAFLPYTTAGDLAYASSATAASRLAIGTALRVLRANAGVTAPEWAGGMSLIAHTVAGGVVANLDFQSIPAGYKHLLGIGYFQQSGGASGENLAIRMNNVSTGAYSDYLAKITFVAGGGAQTVTKWDGSLSGAETYISTAIITTGNYSPFVCVLPNYSMTNHYKPVWSAGLSLWNDSTEAPAHGLGGGRWGDTAAVNRITLFPAFAIGSIAQDSSFSLYGISV